MFIFYALFYLSDSLNNKHVLFTHTCLVFKTTLTEHILQTFIFKKKDVFGVESCTAVRNVKSVGP